MIKNLQGMTIEELLGLHTEIGRKRSTEERIAQQNQLLDEARRRDKIAATVGDVQSHEFGASVHLGALFPGLVFVTESGALAVKMSTRTVANLCDCVELGTGSLIALPRDSRVRPLYLMEMAEAVEEPQPTEEIGRITGEIEIKAPPEWIYAYLNKLAVATGFRGAFGVGLMAAEQWPKRVGVTDMTDKPHGFCHLSADGSGDWIILPDNLEETEEWMGVLVHEFIHILHGPIDRISHSLLRDKKGELAYFKAGEQFLEPFVPMLLVAAQNNLAWVVEPEELQA